MTVTTRGWLGGLFLGLGLIGAAGPLPAQSPPGPAGGLWQDAEPARVDPELSRLNAALAGLAERLRPGSASVERTPYLLRCRPSEAGDIALTVFQDGRAIIHGMTDPDRARSLYARWVGS